MRRRRGILLLPVLLALWLAPARLAAHEPYLSALDLTELEHGTYIARWTLNANEGGPPVEPIFPPHCLWDTPRLECGAQGLNGVIRFEQAGRSQSALVLRIHPLSGASQTSLLTPSQSQLTVRTTPRASLADYADLIVDHMRLGVQHILQGPDHLLFVLGLMWIVSHTGGSSRAARLRLFRTVTAFTVAHSVTLAAATFHVLTPPVVAVNAGIALSILFLGPEMLRAARGGDSLTLRRPDLVAFSFGLLHGFGFASALSDAGLSRQDLPYALAGFNIGVELGQLAFILLLWLVVRAAGQLAIAAPAWARFWPAYVVGGLGAYWTIGRSLLILGV